MPSHRPQFNRRDLRVAAALVALGADIETAAQISGAPLDQLELLAENRRWEWFIDLYRGRLTAANTVARMHEALELAIELHVQSARGEHIEQGGLRAAERLLRTVSTAETLHSSVWAEWKRTNARIPREISPDVSDAGVPMIREALADDVSTPPDQAPGEGAAFGHAKNASHTSQTPAAGDSILPVCRLHAPGPGFGGPISATAGPGSGVRATGAR